MEDGGWQLQSSRQNSLRVGIFLLAFASGARGENWPGWRGPRGGGVSPDKGIPVQWDLSRNVKWKADVPGVGHSSPIVLGNRVFVTTAVSSDPTQETFRKGLYFGGNRSQPDDAEYSWEVHCFDRDSGRLLWKQTALKKRPGGPRHMKNSYASHTPVTDGTHVYAFFVCMASPAVSEGRMFIRTLKHLYCIQ